MNARLADAALDQSDEIRAMEIIDWTTVFDRDCRTYEQREFERGIWLALVGAVCWFGWPVWQWLS